MKEKLKNLLRSKRGSSIIMALVTITVLVLLGAAVATLSMGTLRANVADATNNDAYYAAESGVNNALDQLKLEVSRYYTAMLAVASDSGQYTPLYNNFGNGIVANANGGSFVDPVITGGTTHTEFSVADPQNNVYEFLAVTTSTMADGTKYQVEGRLKVKRVDVSPKKDWFVEDAALVVGGTLTVNPSSGVTVTNHNAVLGALIHQNTWDFKVNNGQTIINQTIEQSINNVLNYPSFSDPAISNPRIYITTNNTTVTADSHGKNSFDYPVSMDTADNINVILSNGNEIPGGIIRARGNLKINRGGRIYSDIYSKNLVENDREIYGNIYAHGDISITSGKIFGNIYSDGSVSLSSVPVYGTVICKGDITVQGGAINNNMFAEGTISLSQVTVTADVVYSKTKIVSSATVLAIMFSGGDIEFNAGVGGGNRGVVIAKGDLNNKSSAWPGIYYDAAEVAAKLNNIKGTFFDTGGSGGGSATLDGSIFQSQSITAKGRVN